MGYLNPLLIAILVVSLIPNFYLNNCFRQLFSYYSIIYTLFQKNQQLILLMIWELAII